MHDTFLLNKISKMVHSICLENEIDKVKYLKIIVSKNSHVNVKNLSEHLMTHNNRLLAKGYIVEIFKDDIEEQTAIIETIQGEQVGK